MSCETISDVLQPEEHLAPGRVQPDLHGVLLVASAGGLRSARLFPGTMACSGSSTGSASTPLCTASRKPSRRGEGEGAAVQLDP